MTGAQLEKIFKYLKNQKWRIFGSAKISGEEEQTAEISPYLKAHQPIDLEPMPAGRLQIKELESINELILSDELPIYPFKNLFIPECETLFEYKGNQLTESDRSHKIALFGINLLDLKAFNLYDLVFANDPYYQRRRKNSLVIGYATNLEKDVYGRNYEPDILEHVHFDIFIEGPSMHSAKQGKLNSEKYKIFAGSIKGQRILEHLGYKKYEYIEFNGPLVNKERMNELRNKLTNHHQQKIWDELGKRCIECGKCTIACPTCFCFRIDDEAGLVENTGVRTRCWDSCYYREFSEVSGPSTSSGQDNKPKFLTTTAQRIHFWYYHKFARIPDEFGIQGCVGCLRCHQVCPVDINIKEVLEDVKK
ncbi:MAG: 4Fe-4S ferredoxin iron-sulfur binding domain protein [Parcubacteria group bacterium GW2011_GWC2_42_6]|nr:MAG: 4Fe-4S ferredoxin iron-sulfur binding domain protein [Parcubacteria group bacterium GW2011_GWC2_42_6]KKT76675.1 MAG: 4Fe-4S ferredoxin iron-sulfur binding domain protein [Parcubacteria group bacterium GW2011_GWF2_44_7]